MTARTLTKSAGQAPKNGVILSIENLETRRERGGIAFVLRVPHISLRSGTFVAIAGASGCGKSTLLDLLALILKPDRVDRFAFACGDSSVVDVADLWMTGNERALAKLRAAHMGYVLQAGGLLPFLSVRDNITLPARINGCDGQDGETERLARALGIADKLNVKPQYLSGGQRQRVAIARALVHRPSVVLADEPTAAVDEARAEQIVHDFRGIARDHGTTVVMVTHNRDLVLPLADAMYSFDVTQPSERLTQSTCYPSQLFGRRVC